MLGAGAISSRAISGSPFSLIAVPGILGTAALALTFSVTLTPGQYFNTSASLGLSFGVNASAYVRQAAAVSIPVTFTFSGQIRNYGKPIILSAMPQSFDLRAMPDSFDITALPESFTLRGAK